MQTLHTCTYDSFHRNVYTGHGLPLYIYDCMAHSLEKHPDSPAVKKTDRHSATTETSSNCSSLLIILMGALGDVARGLCLVSHIKNHWPHCRITWLIETKWVEVVSCHLMPNEQAQ